MSGNDPKSSVTSIEQALTLAVEHHQAGRLAEAQVIYERILAGQPSHSEALHLLGILTSQSDRNQQAIELLSRAVAINPSAAIYQNNLGFALLKQGSIDQAIKCFYVALKIKPDYAEAYYNLGVALQRLDRLDEASAVYLKAIDFKPDDAEAFNNLGNVYKDQGRLDQAGAAFHRAMQINPDSASAHGNLVYSLYFDPAQNAQTISEELGRWHDRHARPLRELIQPHTNSRDPERRLKIGYVSGDFCEHVVGWNLLPLLNEHDHKQSEIFCYFSSKRPPDEVTKRIQDLADVWRNITGIDDQRAAQIIRDDKIDILVDLASHTADNRLLIFARKPAPVQVTWLAYPGSTGLDTVDYRFSDPYLDPPDTDLSIYSEQTVRLEKTYWCYRPGGPAPDVASLPALSAGYITFGCLNNFAKISAPAQKLWIQLLDAVPNARLILHAHEGSHRAAIRERFVRNGIATERMEFIGRKLWPEYIKSYNRIDIGLDPFPYNGGITSCDSLYMGVPVVSLWGQMAVGRAGKSILTNVGLPELIAQTPEEYLQIAIRLAGDLPRLAELRSRLLLRLENSPLMDARRFAQNVEAAYRKMWRDWCAKSQ